MILIGQTTAFLLYLAFSLSALLIFWALQKYKERHRTVLPSESDLYVCEYCHFAYVEKRHHTVNQCPQCHSFNKENTYSHSSLRP